MPFNFVFKKINCLEKIINDQFFSNVSSKLTGTGTGTLGGRRFGGLGVSFPASERPARGLLTVWSEGRQITL